MLELDRVFQDYLPNSEEEIGRVKSRRRPKSGQALAVDTTITKDLPQLIKQFVSSSGRDLEKYRLYGSVGQLNWTLAHIAWVAILRRDITTSTERGYYVVLLFSQNMQNCFLSLSTRASRNFGKHLVKRSGIRRSRRLPAWQSKIYISPQISSREC
jgi:5-methylcytosine-specific restriction enzyme A